MLKENSNFNYNNFKRFFVNQVNDSFTINLNF